MEPLLKPDDVGRWLGVSRATVYALARSGKLPFFRVGGLTVLHLES